MVISFLGIGTSVEHRKAIDVPEHRGEVIGGRPELRNKIGMQLALFTTKRSAPMKNNRQVFVSLNRGFPVAHVAAHFGEELFRHLSSAGIDTTVVRRDAVLAGDGDLFVA